MEISRREFFKVAIKKTIPFLGFIAIAPILNSCSHYCPVKMDK